MYTDVIIRTTVEGGEGIEPRESVDSILTVRQTDGHSDRIEKVLR
jgi:hypothetical protein